MKVAPGGAAVPTDVGILRCCTKNPGAGKQAREVQSPLALMQEQHSGSTGSGVDPGEILVSIWRGEALQTVRYIQCKRDV